MPFSEVSTSDVRAHAHPTWLWDVFCRVIDNFGDIGVCWRLCADLAQRGHTVRLWVDDSSALEWMAPGALHGQWPRVSVMDWGLSSDAAILQTLRPAEVWVEGFGCEIAPEFIAARTALERTPHAVQAPVWVNLEYLSAEDYVERCHALPSPVMQGPAKGWTKHFYYPGFTQSTGGLLREVDGVQPPADWSDLARQQWLTSQGIHWEGERLVSLFCYEPATLSEALASWMRADKPTLLLITAGRAALAVAAALPDAQKRLGLMQDMGALRLHTLPPMSQRDFDAMLNCCDLNLVRGEDSLVRALWAGKPFIWHIYPQDDNAHAEKLAAFLDSMKASPLIRQLHAAWNGLPMTHGQSSEHLTRDWSSLPLADWQQEVQSWRARLRSQPDLVSGLIGFVEKRR
jgi:uncharacterized repeat protein (TIGR03837 family)